MLKRWLNPVPELPAGQVWLRVLWIAVQVALALVWAGKANPFFYQAF